MGRGRGRGRVGVRLRVDWEGFVDRGYGVWGMERGGVGFKG